MYRFRDAIQRRCYGMRRLWIARRFTNLTEVVPEETRKKFPERADIYTDGTHALAPALTAAIQAAEKVATDAEDARAQAAANVARQRRRPRGRGAGSRVRPP